MTTTPTPEQTLAEYVHWRDSNGSIGFADANRLATACEALIAERDEARAMLATAEGLHDAWQAERDQAQRCEAALTNAMVDLLDNAKDAPLMRVRAAKVLCDVSTAAEAIVKERDQALARVKELEKDVSALYLKTLEPAEKYDEWKELAEKAEARVAVLKEALTRYANRNNNPGTWATEALATEDQAAEALLAERDRLKSDLVRMGAELGKETAEIEEERDKLKAQLDVAVAALEYVAPMSDEASYALVAIAKLEETP